MQTPTPGQPGSSDAATLDPLASERPPIEVDPAVEAQHNKWTPAKIAIWVAIALVGAVAWWMIAFSRGESINAVAASRR